MYDLEADSVDYDQNDNSIAFEWIKENSMPINFCEKYRKAARNILPVIDETMKSAIFRNVEDITVDVDMKFIKDKLGGEFAKKHSFTVYWGLKCGLFKEGHFAESYNKREDKIKIRRKKTSDRLPSTLDHVCDC